MEDWKSKNKRKSKMNNFKKLSKITNENEIKKLKKKKNPNRKNESI